jgi:hypothetical protein
MPGDLFGPEPREVAIEDRAEPEFGDLGVATEFDERVLSCSPAADQGARVFAARTSNFSYFCRDARSFQRHRRNGTFPHVGPP